MNKYIICFIIGILIFLIINYIDTFSVGVPFKLNVHKMGASSSRIVGRNNPLHQSIAFDQNYVFETVEELIEYFTRYGFCPKDLVTCGPDTAIETVTDEVTYTQPLAEAVDAAVQSLQPEEGVPPCQTGNTRASLCMKDDMRAIKKHLREIFPDTDRNNSDLRKEIMIQIRKNYLENYEQVKERHRRGVSCRSILPLWSPSHMIIDDYFNQDEEIDPTGGGEQLPVVDFEPSPEPHPGDDPNEPSPEPQSEAGLNPRGASNIIIRSDRQWMGLPEQTLQHISKLVALMDISYVNIVKSILTELKNVIDAGTNTSYWNVFTILYKLSNTFDKFLGELIHSAMDIVRNNSTIKIEQINDILNNLFNLLFNSMGIIRPYTNHPTYGIREVFGILINTTDVFGNLLRLMFEKNLRFSIEREQDGYYLVINIGTQHMRVENPGRLTGTTLADIEFSRTFRDIIRMLFNRYFNSAIRQARQ